MKPTRDMMERGLARAMLTTPWTRASLVGAARAAVLAPAGWIESLVDRLLEEFGKQPPPPRFAALRRAIHADPIFQDDSLDSNQEPLLLRWLVDPPPMQPHPAMQFDVISLRTAGEVADWLDVPLTTLDGWADVKGWLGRSPDGPLQHYHRYLTGHARSPRLIEAPKPQLAKMQRRVLRDVLGPVPTHDAAHGFAATRSILTHARLHCGRPVVLRFDLRQFFPSIVSARILGVFRALGYPERVAEILTGLTTTSTPATPPTLWRALPRDQREHYRFRHLPQGAPTSPALSNLVGYRLDARLSGLAGAFSATYSRYADDLTFSGDHRLDRDFDRFETLLRRVVDDEGFTLNAQKTRRMRAGVRQRVTGLVVNRIPNLPRVEYDRLKATLHNCSKRGPASQNRDGVVDFRSVLLGKVAFAEMVNAQRGAKLRAIFDEIRWD